MAGAYEDPGKTITLEAAVDLSGAQFHAVNVDVNGKAILAVAGARGIGIQQNKPSAAVGQPVTVMVNGVSKAVNGTAGALAAGSQVMSDATGRCVAAATAGSETLGTALTGATAQGELIALLVNPGYTV